MNDAPPEKATLKRFAAPTAVCATWQLGGCEADGGGEVQLLRGNLRAELFSVAEGLRACDPVGERIR